MPRGPMSPAARAKIAAAQKKRWAAHRAAKAAGNVTSGPKKRGRPPGSKNKRRGRPSKAAAASAHNPFMNMTIQALVAARKNVEDAWNATLAMLGMGGISKGKGKRGRPKKKK